MKEYAPGIPRKDVTHPLPKIGAPKTWEFGVHEHHAEKRGLHYDLRLGDPKTGHAHSWALPAKWPKAGEFLWAIQQPTHTVKYMDFEGTLPPGYGAGKVNLKDREKTEVTKAEPGYISFNVYRGTGPEEYSLRHIGGKVWRFSNKTLHRAKAGHLPDAKPAYKEIPISKIPLEDENTLLSAKVDDAHNLFFFPKTGEQVRVVSYRQAKRAPGGLIEHTHKVKNIYGLKTPKELSGTILRGGLFGMDPKTGKPTEAHILGGLLNANVWKSREKQQEHGNLLPVLYDVVRHNGKDMSNAPYADKLAVLEKVQRLLPNTFELPNMARTEKEKRQLLAEVVSGKHPQTSEGVVIWDLKRGSAPSKAKIKNEQDVYIKGFFPGEGRLHGKAVGGFVYSHEPDGRIVGKVGTGLSDAQRAHMHQHSEDYIGAVAVVESRGRFGKSQALRAPAFIAYHLDKNPQTTLDKLKL